MLNKKKSAKVIGIGLASLMMASALTVSPVELAPNGIHSESMVAHAASKFSYFSSTTKQAKNQAAKYAMENAKKRHSSSINKIGSGGRIDLNGEGYRVDVKGRIYQGDKYINKTVLKGHFVVKKGYFYKDNKLMTGKVRITSKTLMYEECEFYVYKGRIVNVNWLNG